MKLPVKRKDGGCVWLKPILPGTKDMRLHSLWWQVKERDKLWIYGSQNITQS